MFYTIFFPVECARKRHEFHKAMAQGVVVKPLNR